MKFSKFTTYETVISVPSSDKKSMDEFKVEYKIDENDRDNSFMNLIRLNEDDLDKSMESNMVIPVPILNSLYEMMKEVDPFSFAFDDEDGDV